MVLTETRTNLYNELSKLKKEYGVPQSEIETLLMVFEKYSEDIFLDTIASFVTMEAAKKKLKEMF